MTNRFFFIALLLSLFAFSACVGTRGPDTPLRISVPASVSSIPMLTLDGKRIAGRLVSVSIFQDHSLTLAEFLRGDVDVLMTGFTQGAAAFTADPEVRLLVTPVWGVSSLMVRDGSISSMSDLRGKKLMIPFAGSPLDLQTHAILEAEGLAGKVDIVYGPPQQAAALLLAGKTDAAAVPEPIPSRLEASGKAFRLARYQDLWARATGGEPRSPQVSLFVKRSFADAHRELIAALVEAAADATSAVMADPIAAAEQRAAVFKLDPAIVRTGLENTLFGLPDRDENMRLSADYMQRLGRPAIDRAFYYEY
ncbi:MAG: ABC transporter substrate-binding protein [Spirochaetales bacterium]|nr:ABC transporter substrate-binding protein [Spirochaetales bacterium]